jgi:hypothetical protein
MNKLLLTTLGLLAALSAYAQGTFNASNSYVPTGATAKAFVLDALGVPLLKANGRVEILNAADQASLSPNGAAGVALGADGLFFINNLVVPGVAAGGSANIVVRAWDVTTGATFADATAKSSGLVTVSPLGGGPTPAATFAANSNFVGLTLSAGPIVPEPSTIALAAFGVAGLFFVARRKS